MEHGIGCGSPAPGCRGRTAEGVMVRRSSVASLDSGAESPVYGGEPSASADRGNPVAKPSWACGGRWRRGPTMDGRLRPGVPRCDPNGGLVVSAALPGTQRRDPARPRRARSRASCRASPERSALAASHVSGSAERGDTRQQHGDRGLDASRAGRDGCAATRRNLRHVGRRPAKRKMVCKGHPCIYAADGEPNDLVRVIVGRTSRSAVPSQAH